VGVAPAVCNAVVDAMRPLRLVIDEVPLTPARLRQAIRDAQRARPAGPVRDVTP
jgi:carbon-monoxide dehydrogenase large subunit